MIEGLLPPAVVTVEAYGRDDADLALYPEEAALMARAVAQRRHEFAVVRSCARRAMKKLGVPPQPVLPAERGAPGWPAGWSAACPTTTISAQPRWSAPRIWPHSS